ncbi:MAG: VanZ family protein [Microbacteriaceae bacterium]|nr:VanZ family protein [Microbacteriaceae bacterium]
MVGPILTPGILAILIGSAGMVVAFVPLVALAYRRDGRLGALRIVGWFAAAIYGVALLTYTLLPLPAHRQLAHCTGAQLHPLGSVLIIADYPHATLRELAVNPALLQVVLNVALFLPLGALVRWFWGRGWPWALGIGFALSLFIETTQLTGVWGIYSCAYRVFDVDDLAANTAGAVLGSLLSIPLTWRGCRHPDGTRVTLWRVGLAVGCDLLLMLLGGGLLVLGARLWIVAAGGTISAFPPEAETLVFFGVPFAGQAVSILAGSRTLGEGIVLLRGRKGRWPAWAARPVKLLTGPGGFLVLLWAPRSGPFPILFILFVLVSATMLLFTRTHRGLPGWASDLDLVDVRTPDLTAA